MSIKKEDRVITEITDLLESLFGIYERKTGVEIGMWLDVGSAKSFKETGVVQWHVLQTNRKPLKIRETVSVIHVKVAPEEDGTVDFERGLLSISFSIDGNPSWWYRTDTQLHVFVQKFTEHYYNYIVKKVKE